MRAFFDVSGICLTLASAFFLLRGNLGLSPESIAELSITRLDYKSAVIESLASQNADTRVGLALLIVAFVCQVSAHARSPRRAPAAAALVAVIGASIVGVCVADKCAENTVDDAIRVLKESPDQGKTTWKSLEQREAEEKR